MRAPYDPMPHGPAEVGVGPWEGPWPSGEQYDAQLLAEGDRRNVVDRYRYWTVEAIVADLDTRRHDFHVAIENVASQASRAAADRPGPSWPKRRQTRRGRSVVSRCSEPGRLSTP